MSPAPSLLTPLSPPPTPLLPPEPPTARPPWLDPPPADSMTGGRQGRIHEQGRIDDITDAARDFALQLPWALLLVPWNGDSLLEWQTIKMIRKHRFSRLCCRPNWKENRPRKEKYPGSLTTGKALMILNCVSDIWMRSSVCIFASSVEVKSMHEKENECTRSYFSPTRYWPAKWSQSRAKSRALFLPNHERWILLLVRLLFSSRSNWRWQPMLPETFSGDKNRRWCTVYLQVSCQREVDINSTFGIFEVNRHPHLCYEDHQEKNRKISKSARHWKTQQRRNWVDGKQMPERFQREAR